MTTCLIVGLTWEYCVGICTDGAPSMVGSIKGFVTLAKKANKQIITTHCFLHREALVAKTLGLELKGVLDEVVKMVNFIKSRPLKSRIFTKLCEEIGSEHVNLILHTEIRWLSRGRVMSRVHELKEEMLTFFTLEGKEEYSELLGDKTWCTRLAYLTEIFELLNKVNSSLQGRNKNILTSTDKIHSLKEKIILWKIRVLAEGNLDMFPNTAATNNNEIIPLIIEHLTIQQDKIQHYFPNISIENYDWVRNPFVFGASNNVQLSIKEEEEFTDICNDRTLRLKHKEVELETFWIQISDEYPQIAKKALIILLQFSTSYLCESGFSALTNIKCTNRQRLETVEEEMIVCLSSVRPNIEGICQSNQAQVPIKTVIGTNKIHLIIIQLRIQY